MTNNHRKIAKLYGDGLTPEEFWVGKMNLLIAFPVNFLRLVEEERIKARESTTNETLRNMAIEGFLARKGQKRDPGKIKQSYMDRIAIEMCRGGSMTAEELGQHFISTYKPKESA